MSLPAVLAAIPSARLPLQVVTAYLLSRPNITAVVGDGLTARVWPDALPGEEQGGWTREPSLLLVHRGAWASEESCGKDYPARVGVLSHATTRSVALRLDELVKQELTSVNGPVVIFPDGSRARIASAARNGWSGSLTEETYRTPVVLSIYDFLMEVLS